MLTESQVFRAVLTNGKIYEITVTREYPEEGEIDDRERYKIRDPWVVYPVARAQDPQSAVLQALRYYNINYVELRGPGELTTAEQVAAAVEAQQRQCRWFMCGRKCHPNGAPLTAQESRELWPDATPAWIAKVLAYCVSVAEKSVADQSGWDYSEPNGFTVERPIDAIRELTPGDVQRALRG